MIGKSVCRCSFLGGPALLLISPYELPGNKKINKGICFRCRRIDTYMYICVYTYVATLFQCMS